MKITMAHRLAAAVACVGMLFPQATMAGAPAPLDVVDVALRDGGLFVGRVVNEHGKPFAEAEVVMMQAGEEVAKTTTDENGAFAVQGLRSGQYQVASEGGVVAYRLWAPETAPPAANATAQIVTGQTVINGQWGGGGVMNFIRSHPMLVAAGVATAIAVPLAVADDDDSNS